MDPEQAFLRVHARLSGMLSQLLTPRIRMVLEYIYLAVAVALFCLLVVMHTNFVQQIVSAGLWTRNADYQNIVDFPEGSLIEGSNIPDVSGDESTILTAKFWSSWIGSSAWRSKLIFKSWKSDKETSFWRRTKHVFENGGHLWLIPSSADFVANNDPPIPSSASICRFRRQQRPIPLFSSSARPSPANSRIPVVSHPQCQLHSTTSPAPFCRQDRSIPYAAIVRPLAHLHQLCHSPANL
ncbi:hypothetical protein KSP40_PGU004341 [Platanthera guangdongensis]|uniref:Uncharacterized protein n=1 Tax=Platanthera guangdongensis TaxID=2320717 RepID=A0ABR2MW41_9ASPA